MEINVESPVKYIDIKHTDQVMSRHRFCSIARYLLWVSCDKLTLITKQ